MENRLKYKLIIAASLLISVFLLAFLYFRNSGDSSGNNNTGILKPPQKQLTAEEMKIKLDNDVDSVLYMFGIKKEWIKERDETHGTNKKEQKKKTEQTNIVSKGSLWFSKDVSVPRDLPVAEVNLELTKHLSNIEFGCMGSENPKNGTVTIDIYHLRDSSRKTLANITFLSTDRIKRETADVCIILDDVGSYSIKELEEILSSNENFSVILPEQIDKIDAQTIVMDSKRDYLLRMRIGNEDDIAAEFRTDMGDKEMKIKVRTTCYEFDKAAGVITVNPRKLYRLENDVLYEFTRYNLRAFRDTTFIRFISEEGGSKKVDKLLKDIKTRSSKGNRSLIYLVNLNPEEFSLFCLESYKIKRLGYRFYNFSDIFRHRIRTENLTQEEQKN